MENQEEIWKDIPCLEEMYQVSNIGNVRSLDRKSKKGFLKGKNLSVWSSPGKYPRITLTNKLGREKTYTVHRLVAISFIDNPFQKLYVNHKNGIKTDNRVENLEWATINENMQHAFDTGLLINNPMLKGYKGELSPVCKLSDIDIMMIKCLYKNGFNSTIIGKKFKVHPSHILLIIKLKTRNQPINL